MKKIIQFLRKLWNWIRSIFRKKRTIGPEGPTPERDNMPECEEQSKTNNMSNDNRDDSSNNISRNKEMAKEFRYLYCLIYYRIRESFRKDKDDENKKKLPEIPELEDWGPYLREFIKQHNLKKDEEKILLLVALAPYIYPDLFDDAIAKGMKDAGVEKFNDIGGVLTGRNCPFFLPTGETVIYLVNGPDKSNRFEVQQLFGAEHVFWEKKILWLENTQDAEPPIHGRLIMSSDYVHKLTTGSHESPQFSISFPAKKIAPIKPPVPKPEGYPDPPKLDDLVVPIDLKIQIRELMSWVKYKEELKKKMKGRLKKGYRTLFYGLPGTGKSFTAEILGYELKRDVYKIDLSMVVSKYIGETEKNLELLFARAEDTGWILFFDEADALFGKRTNVKDAHDKYANQEVSYLLQRIEDYDGLVILASNRKYNIDEAFTRRFNSMLLFPFPNAEQRAMIWEKSFPPGTIFREKDEDDLILGMYDEDCKRIDSPRRFNLADAVKKYELTGGNIINVIQYAGIRAVERTCKVKKPVLAPCPGEESENHEEEEEVEVHLTKDLVIYYRDVLDGIRRELYKEGKPFTQ